MERSALVIACLLLTACTSQQTSQPLSSPVVTAGALQWHSTRLPVTQCQSNIISDFNLTLTQSGEWHCIITLANIDTHGELPDWRNEITLQFQNGKEEPVILPLFRTTIHASSKHMFKTIKQN